MNGHPLAHVPQRKHLFKSVPLRQITSEARERSHLTVNISVLLIVGFASMSGLIVFFPLIGNLFEIRPQDGQIPEARAAPPLRKAGSLSLTFLDQLSFVSLRSKQFVIHKGIQGC
jgi:hypothetical protein